MLHIHRLTQTVNKVPQVYLYPTKLTNKTKTE